MSSLLVIGTIAIDNIETPYDRRDSLLGGSATYFAAAASYFGGVSLVGVVGEDFPETHLDSLRERGVDCGGVEIVTGGKTFSWSGRYEADWNTRHTLDTQLNVLADFEPKIAADHAESEYVFLANASPEVQLKALEQCSNSTLVVADTMNLWIEGARDGLAEVLRRVDGLVLNDEEARMLSGKRNLFQAARDVLEMGPSFVILKKGEHGAFLFGDQLHFSLPAYPVEDVVDPTGAGDSFAGGFMGYISSVRNTMPHTLRRAMLYGTVTASYCVQGFSTDELMGRDRSDVETRFNELLSIVTL
jgi:sugar/nucleoside kinase (ribokinase family)